LSTELLQGYQEILPAGKRGAPSGAPLPVFLFAASFTIWSVVLSTTVSRKEEALKNGEGG
jgi:hypothetical protein